MVYDVLFSQLLLLELVLVVQVLISSSSIKHPTQSQILYKKIVIYVLIMVVLDNIACIMNAKTFTGAPFVREALNTLYFVFLPLPCYYFLLYCQSKIFYSLVIDMKNKLLWFIPALIHFLIVVINCFVPFIFTFDANGIYRRLPYFMVELVFVLFYVVVSYFIIIRAVIKEKSISYKKDYFFLFIYLTICTIGIVIQYISDGLDATWVSSSLAIFLLYVKLQNAQIARDYLTNIYNKRYFDKFLNQIFASHDSNQWVLLMIDVDHFKSINDTYGHVEGDFALIKVAAALKNATHPQQDFVARYGGDEFVILSKKKNDEEIIAFKEKINQEIEKMNKSINKPYSLSLSIGSSYLKELEEPTFDEFVMAADKAMYIEKNKHC